jgi:hypothetical protein
MNPIVDGLEKKYGREFRIVRVDVATSQGKQLAREQGCIGQPTFVLFNKAGEPARKLIGAQTVETFEREIEKILAD